MAQQPYRYQSWKGEAVETDQCIYCLAVDGSHAEDCEQANPFVGPTLTSLTPCTDPHCLTTTLSHFEWCQNSDQQVIDSALAARAWGPATAGPCSEYRPITGLSGLNGVPFCVCGFEQRQHN